MKAQTLATDASYTDLYNLDDWSLVCAMCHYEGSHRSLLDDSAWRVACAQADGFGDLRRLKATAEYGTKEDLAQLVSEMPHASDLYKQVFVDGDWSHFRDSSEAGTKRTARFLRALLDAWRPLDEQCDRARFGDHCDHC